MNLVPIIHNALLGGSKESQEQGERALISLRQSNPEQFLVECSRLTKEQKLDELVRQSAATVLGLSLMIKDVNGNYLWDTVSAQSKKEIRNNLLNTLVSPVEKAKRGASNAISRIATIEVPRGEWQDLIVTLLNNTTNVNEEFKRTSLMTVGFICEQFKQHSVTLPQTLESTMLATLIQATRDPQVATKLSALKAIRESLGFMSNVLAQKSVRDHIFALLLDALKERETVEVALQGISEFVKINFEHMDTYIIALFDATFPLLTIPSNITISALDIWDYIGFQYLDRLNNAVRRTQNKEAGSNLLMQVHETLVPAVLSNLIVIDGDENSIREAALKAMTTIAEACGKVVFTVVTTFVSNTIQSPDEKIRQASSLAFSTLCECRGAEQKKAVQNLLSIAIDKFVGLLTDQSRLVVESTAIAFIKFNEFYSGIFLRSVTFPLIQINYESYISTFMNAMSRGEKVQQSLISSICNLTEGLNHPDNRSCRLMQDPFPLLNKLTTLGFASRVNDIIYGSFMAVTGILQTCSDPFLAINYIEHLVLKYQEFMGSDDISKTVRSSLLTALHSSVLVLRDKNQPADDAVMDKVFAFVCYHFDTFREVDGDGLYVISGLATTFEKKFGKHLDRSWGYIVHALTKENDMVLVKSALICISDLARSLEGRFSSKFEEALTICFAFMRKNIDRMIKCQIFLTMADLMVSEREKASKHRKEILDVIDLGFQGVVDLQNSSSDDFEYAEQLKESVIDFYECVSASIIDIKVGCPLFREHFKKLVWFVILTTKRQINPIVDYLKSCMFLVFDAANCYMNDRSRDRKEIDNEVRRPELKEVLRILQNYSTTNEEIKELLVYSQRIYG